MKAHPLCLALLVAAGLAAPAAAQDDKRVSREREALRRTQLALKAADEQRETLLREKSTWLTEKATLDAALEQAQMQAAASQAQAQAERGRNAQLRLGVDAAARTVADWKQALAGSETRAAELAKTLAQAQATLEQRTRTLASVTALLERSTQAGAAAEQKNRQLIALSRELIEQVRLRTGTEPVLGLGRVELENWSEAQRDRVDAQRLVPGRPAEPSGERQ